MKERHHDYNIFKPQRRSKFITNYDIYHDESQENGYWHGILLVPKDTRKQLLNYLKIIRDETKYPHPITLKGLDKKSKKFECVRMWIELGVNALIQDFKGKQPPKIYCRKRTHSPHERRQATDYCELPFLSAPIKAKFILFKERDNHQTMDSSWFPDHASKIETTYRMGLKGGLHFLFDDDNPVQITSIHFDGYEHHKRQIDRSRVIGRLQGVGVLRDYCSLPYDALVDDRTGNHTKPYHQEYDDCQLLQLTDLLVGAFRTVLGESKNKIQEEASLPVNDLVQKWEDGYARMGESRWFKGFYISECYLENGQWRFNNLMKRNESTCQLMLFK